MVSLFARDIFEQRNCLERTVGFQVERRKHDTRRGVDLSNSVQLVDDAMEKWQQDWANSYKGRWTYRLIPSVVE